MLKVRLERFSSERIDRDDVCFRIVRIRPHELGQSTAELRLLFSIKSFVIGSERTDWPNDRE